jgi:two-component system, NarL family, nitrate/nitrite response regulator NarL
VGEAVIEDEKATTVLVANTSRMDCQLLAEAIQRHNDFRVIACATSSGEIMSAFRDHQPDVAVVSERLEDGAFAGLRVLRQLLGLHRRSRIVMLLDHDERELVVEALRTGARGIFCRSGSSKELRKCIRSVHTGQIWVNNAQMEHIIEALKETPAARVVNGEVAALLTKREEEVARLVAGGLSNRDVSEKLGLSEHTVKNYLFHIFEKLSVSTRIELVLYILSQEKPLKSTGELPADLGYQAIA